MQASQAPKTVKLDGSLTVDKASALRDELAEALASSESVLVGISSVEELDLACLQVLYAAKASAAATGKALHFIGSAPPRVAKRLAACGFLRGVSEQAGDFESALVGF